MSTDLPTPDAALAARFFGGDENALTTLYRQQYDNLVKAARNLLGDDLAYASGRVAEKAMLDAWQERSKIPDASALASFLTQAVADEVVIQKRKHAALHQHGPAATHPPVPNVEEAMQKLLGKLQAPVADHKAAVAEARAARLSAARLNVERVSARPRWVLPLVGIVALGVAFAFFQRWINRAGADIAVDRALKADGVQTLSSGKGQRGSLELRDGTKAALGSDSRLRVPSEFASTQRTIQLEGTATFTVTPDTSEKAMSFAVRAGDATVTANGTVFSVRYYPDDSTLYVLVNEGTVNVRDRVRKSSKDLSAGEAIRMTPDGTMSDVDQATKDATLAWARDSLIFEATPLRQAVPELIRWFGIDAELADSSIADRPVSMRVDLTSSGEAIKALTKAAGLAITFGKNDRIEFRDSTAVPAAKGKKR